MKKGAFNLLRDTKGAARGEGVCKFGFLLAALGTHQHWHLLTHMYAPA